MASAFWFPLLLSLCFLRRPSPAHGLPYLSDFPSFANTSQRFFLQDGSVPLTVNLPLYCENLQINNDICSRFCRRVVTAYNLNCTCPSGPSHLSGKFDEVHHITPGHSVSSSLYGMTCSDATVLVAVEGGALDVAPLARAATVVVVIGRNPFLMQPGGGRGKDGVMEFFHELSFPIWSRKGREGLGLNVYPVRMTDSTGYKVPVPEVLDAIEAGLRDVADARLALDLREENASYGEVRRRAWFHCLDTPPCGVERAEKIVKAATAPEPSPGDDEGVCPGRSRTRAGSRDPSAFAHPSSPSTVLSPRTLEALAPVLEAAEAGRALEIGGPTTWLQDLYTPGLSIDNVVRDVSDGYAARGGGLGEWEEEGTNEFPYVVHGVGKGTTYVRDGSDLHGLADESYDLVLSSHNLEHFLDPLAALLEWNRVLRPGGYLFLVLPWPAATYDRKRKADDIAGLIRRHSDPSRDRLIEEPLRAILELTDYEAIDAGDPAKAEEEFRKQVGDGHFWHDRLHWTVFDFELIEDLMDCLGWGVKALDLIAPYHMVALAQKPV